MKDSETKAEDRCSWCGKSVRQLRTLVAGPGGFICDGCVAMCNEVLAASGTLSSGSGNRKRWLRRKAGWTGYEPLA